MAMTPEGRVKEAVKRRLKALGIYFYMPTQNGLGRVGIPDFICCYDGTFIAIETKAPGKLKTVTANQERELQSIRDAGGVAVVIDDVSQLDGILWTM